VQAQRLFIDPPPGGWFDEGAADSDAAAVTIAFRRNSDDLTRNGFSG
jgi:hypothetical protein